MTLLPTFILTSSLFIDKIVFFRDFLKRIFIFVRWDLHEKHNELLHRFCAFIYISPVPGVVCMGRPLPPHALIDAVLPFKAKLFPNWWFQVLMPGNVRAAGSQEQSPGGGSSGEGFESS